MICNTKWRLIARNFNGMDVVVDGGANAASLDSICAAVEPFNAERPVNLELETKNECDAQNFAVLDWIDGELLALFVGMSQPCHLVGGLFQDCIELLGGELELVNLLDQGEALLLHLADAFNVLQLALL